MGEDTKQSHVRLMNDPERRAVRNAGRIPHDYVVVEVPALGMDLQFMPHPTVPGGMLPVLIMPVPLPGEIPVFPEERGVVLRPDGQPQLRPELEDGFAGATVRIIVRKEALSKAAQDEAKRMALADLDAGGTLPPLPSLRGAGNSGNAPA